VFAAYSAFNVSAEIILIAVMAHDPAELARKVAPQHLDRSGKNVPASRWGAMKRAVAWTSKDGENEVRWGSQKIGARTICTQPPRHWIID